MADDTDIDTNSPTNDPAGPNRDSGSYASVDDLTVKRDEKGELLPVDKDTATFGRVRVLPMAYGAVEKHFGDAGEVADVGSDEIARILDEHVIEPDLSGAAGGRVTGEWVRDHLKPLAPRDLIMAVLSASDVDADVMMDDQGGAQVALDEGNPR